MSVANKRQAKFLAKWIEEAKNSDPEEIERALHAWDELRLHESTRG